MNHEELQVITQGAQQMMRDRLELQVLRGGSCLPVEARDTLAHYGRVDLELRSAGLHQEEREKRRDGEERGERRRRKERGGE